MILNNSVPLRIPPHWINRDTDEELLEKLKFKELASKAVSGMRTERIDPKYFLDTTSITSSFKGTSWAIEYLDYLVRSGGYTLVNSVSGRIEEILLTIFLDKSDEEYNERQKAVYTTLIKDLGSQRSYKILCKKEEHEIIQKWFEALDLVEVNFEYFFSVFNVTCWAQDPYVALYSSTLNRTILAESNDFNRFDDQTIGCDVGAQSDTILDFPSYYYLQGGNILCSLDYVLIGKDYVEKNKGRAFLGDEQGVLNAFSGLFDGKKCISVGMQKSIPHELRTPPKEKGKCVTRLTFSGTWQPVFHIDMFITLTGIRNEDDQKEILVIGSLDEAQRTLKDLGLPFSDAFQQLSDAYAEYFKEIAHQLKAYFHVLEIPIFPGKASFGYAGTQYETNYFLTYNNVVIENFRDENGAQQKHVFMPTYAKDDTPDSKIDKTENEIRVQLDKKATKVWEKVGFKVFPMPDMESFASSGGAVHCLTKILKRNSNSIP